MKTAENVKIIWDADNAGWYVRYDQPGRPLGGIALDEAMGMPDEHDIDRAELVDAARDALAYASHTMPDEYEIID